MWNTDFGVIILGQLNFPENDFLFLYQKFGEQLFYYQYFQFWPFSKTWKIWFALNQIVLWGIKKSFENISLFWPGNILAFPCHNKKLHNCYYTYSRLTASVVQLLFQNSQEKANSALWLVCFCKRLFLTNCHIYFKEIRNQLIICFKIC